jgi:hypothetical protein
MSIRLFSQATESKKEFRVLLKLVEYVASSLLFLLRLLLLSPSSFIQTQVSLTNDEE